MICPFFTAAEPHMPHPIETPRATDFRRLLEVWEAAVRATHDFLEEHDIQLLKPLLIEQYFPQVQLSCMRGDDGTIAGFLGYAEGKVEMLRSEEHTSELQSQFHLVCRLLLEKN